MHGEDVLRLEATMYVNRASRVKSLETICVTVIDIELLQFSVRFPRRRFSVMLQKKFVSFALVPFVTLAFVAALLALPGGGSLCGGDRR